MMKPILNTLHSPDLLNMQDDLPADIESFSMLVQAFVGPSDGPGEESFDFLVCTPHFLATLVKEKGFLFGKNYLIVQHYNYQMIFDVIDSLCSQISGSSWNEVAEKLGRFGKWEFEDYRELE